VYGESSVELNMGNYQVRAYSSTDYYSTASFQIKPGQTTEIIYGNNNDAVIQY
jgi:hypothetical protein